MYLKKVLLENFRSYERKLVEFGEKTNLILGPNGSGKTNLLEAIYFLSNGKSFRGASGNQLIKWDEKLASVRGKIVNKDYEKEIEVQLLREESGSLKRRFLTEKVIKTRAQYWGETKVVVFGPEDLRLITSSPTRRREFLDQIFSNIEWRYASAGLQYQKALKHRNELLDLIATGKADKSELFYWNQSLIKNAQIIQNFRLNWIKSSNLFMRGHENHEINKLSINYQPSIISTEKLDELYRLELQSGYTKCGPHLDDFSIEYADFETKDKNIALWGSRGQQRLAVLALRLAQINYLEEQYEEAPILLLDDIFSELDDEHRKIVTDVCQKYQSIFTSAEEEATEYLPDAQIIKT